MRGFGYPHGDDEAEQPVELREVTLLCDVEDLRRLAVFIHEAIATCDAAPPSVPRTWHLHLRDRDARWSEQEVDVILQMKP